MADQRNIDSIIEEENIVSTGVLPRIRKWRILNKKSSQYGVAVCVARLAVPFLTICTLTNVLTHTYNIFRLERDSTQPSAPSSAAGDGCYHVFLDVGANIGVHTRFLFEPHLYHDATIAQRLYDEHFGNATTRDNRDVCAFAFEPNPNHAATLQRTAQAYQAQGWRYHVTSAGVSDRDDTMIFHRNDYNGQNSEWGFSVQQRVSDRPVEQVVVPVLHLAHWLQKHIAARRIPGAGQIHGNYPRGPLVVMKMDI
jgi:FkbM family methyltransferase